MQKWKLEQSESRRQFVKEVTVSELLQFTHYLHKADSMTRDLKEQANSLSPGWAVQGGLWLINSSWRYSSQPAAFLVCLEQPGYLLTLEAHRYTIWALNKEDRVPPRRNKEQKAEEIKVTGLLCESERTTTLIPSGEGWMEGKAHLTIVGVEELGTGSPRKRHQSRKIPLPEGIKDTKLRTSPHHNSSSTGEALHTPAHPTAMAGAQSFPGACCPCAGISQPQGRTGWSLHGTANVLLVWKAVFQ